MFETLVVSLLNKYLGQFIEQLNADQLKLSVYSGEVNLENLKVQPSSLDFLHLPITVKVGSVGRLHLKANWAKLSSVPVQVVLERVFLVAGPKTEVRLDENTERKNALASKLAQLQAIEDAHISGKTDAAAKPAGDESFGTAIVTKIVDNLQIKIKDIHIRYEDLTDPARPINVGFGLQELSALTTNAAGREEFVVGATKMFKAVQLKNMFLYCNTRGADAKPVKDLSELGIVFKTLGLNNVQYLLQPVSGSMSLVINKEVHPPPRVKVDSQIDALHVQLSEDQFQRLLQLVSVLTTSRERMGTELEKFQFAFKSGTESERKVYAQLYKRTLNAVWLPDLSADEKKQKEAMEMGYSFEFLSRARAGAIVELRKEIKGKAITLRAAAEKKDTGFFSLFRSKGKTPDAPEVQLSEKDREQIYKDLDIDLSKDVKSADGKKKEEVLPPTYVALELAFRLPKLGVHLLNSSGQYILQLQSNNTNLKLTKYTESIVLAVQLATWSLTDRATANTLYPDLVLPVSAITESAPVPGGGGAPKLALTSANDQKLQIAVLPVLSFGYEWRPLNDANVDMRIALDIQPIQLVLHAPLIDRLLRFFNPPSAAPLDLHVLSDWSSQRLASLKQSTTQSLSDALKSHTSMDLKISLLAPILVIPQSPTDYKSDVLVVELGKYVATSILQSKSTIEDLRKTLLTVKQRTGQSEESLLNEETRLKCYDRIALAGSRISVFFSNNGPAWVKSGYRSFLLKETSISAAIDRSVAPDVAWLPSIKIDSELPALHVHVHSSDYGRLIMLGRAFGAVGAAPAGTAPAIPKPTEAVIAREVLKMTGDKPKGLASTRYSGDNELLTLGELTTVMGSEKEAKQLLSEIDLDKNGVVTMTEFEDWWARRKEVLKHNKTLFLSFKLPQLCLTLTNDRVPAHKYEVMEVRIAGVALNLSSRTFDTLIAGGLKQLTVEDKITKHGDVFRYIVQTFAYDIDESVVRRVMNAAYEVDAKQPPTSGGDKSAPPAVDVLAARALPGVSAQQSAANAGGSGTFVSLSIQLLSIDSPDYQKNPTNSRVAVQIGAILVCVDPVSVHEVGTFFLKDFFNAPPPPPEAKATAEADAARTAAATKLAEKLIDKKLAPDNPAAAKAVDKLKVAATASNPKTAQHLIKEVEADEKAIVTPTRKPKREAVTLSQIDIQFRTLNVLLTSLGQRLANVTIRDVNVAITQHANAMSLHAHLGKLSVLDLSPAGARCTQIVETLSHTYFDRPLLQIASVRDSKSGFTAGAGAVAGAPEEEKEYLFSLQFQTFSEFDADYPGHNGELRGLFQGLRVVYFHRFIMELVFYFSAGPLGEFFASLSGPPPTAEDGSPLPLHAIRYEANGVSQPNVLFKLANIELVFPKSSYETEERLTAKLDTIQLSNSVEIDTFDESKKFQQLRFVLTQFRFMSDIRDRATGRMERTNFLDLDTTELLINLFFHRRVSTVGIVLDSSGLVINLTHHQLQFMIGLISGNFFEVPTIIVPTTVSDLRIRREAADDKSFDLEVTRRHQLKHGGRRGGTTHHSAEQEVLSRINLAFVFRTIKAEIKHNKGLSPDDAFLTVLIQDVSTKVEMPETNPEKLALILEVSLRTLLVTDDSIPGRTMNGKPVLPAFRQLISLTTSSDQPTSHVMSPKSDDSPSRDAAHPSGGAIPSQPIAVRRMTPPRDGALIDKSPPVVAVGSPFSAARAAAAATIEAASASVASAPSADDTSPHSHAQAIAAQSPGSGSPFSTARRLNATHSMLPTTNLPPPYPFVFRYRRSAPSVYGPERGQFMEVFLQNMRFSLAAVLFRLPEFFAVPESSITKPPPPPNPIASTANSKSAGGAQRSASDEPAYPIYIRGHLLSPMIQLIADPTDRHSKGLALTWSLEADVSLTGETSSNLSILTELFDVSLRTMLFDVVDAGSATKPAVIQSRPDSKVAAMAGAGGFGAAAAVGDSKSSAPASASASASNGLSGAINLGVRDSTLIPAFGVRGAFFSLPSPLLEADSAPRAMRGEVEIADIKVTVNMLYYRLVLQCINTLQVRAAVPAANGGGGAGAGAVARSDEKRDFKSTATTTIVTATSGGTAASAVDTKRDEKGAVPMTGETDDSIALTRTNVEKEMTVLGRIRTPLQLAQLAALAAAREKADAKAGGTAATDKRASVKLIEPPALTVEKEEAKKEIREASAISRDRGFGDLQFGVRIHTVWVTLINDVHTPASAAAVIAAASAGGITVTGAAASVPVARLTLGDLTGKLVAFGHSRSGVVAIDFGIQFWNGNLLEWEPLFEPWKVTASSMQSMNTLAVDHPSYHSMIVTSDKVANINLTQTMLKDVMDAAAVFAYTTVTASDEKAKQLALADEKQVWAPYLIENGTEVPITVEIGYSQHASTSPLTSAPYADALLPTAVPATAVVPAATTSGGHVPPPLTTLTSDQWDEKYGSGSIVHTTGVTASGAAAPSIRVVSTFEVPAYSQKPFFFKDSIDARGRMATVQFAQSADKISLPLSSMRYCRTHQIRVGRATPHVVCKMSFVGASKVIKLHSRIGLVNKTSDPLMLVIARAAEYKFATDRVGAAQTLFFPILAPPELQVFVLPSADHKCSTPVVFKHSTVAPAGAGPSGDDVSGSGTAVTRATPTKAGTKPAAASTPSDKEKEKAKKKKLVSTRYFACTKPSAPTYYYSVVSKTLIERDYTLVSIQAPLVIENLLTHGVEVRIGHTSPDPTSPTGMSKLLSPKKSNVVLRTDGSVVERAIARGKIRHSHAIDTFGASNSAGFSICIPELKYGWSDAIEVKRIGADDSKLGSILKETVNTVTRDEDGRELRINIEFEYTPGSTRAVVYCTHWLFNMTRQLLQISEDKKRIYAVGGAGSRDAKRGDERTPSMFGYAPGTKKLTAHVRVEGHTSDEGWCKPFSTETVGFTGAVQCALPSPPHLKKQPPFGMSEVGTTIDAGAGRFWRTKMVTFVPRYVIINKLSTDILIQQKNTRKLTNPIIVKAGAQSEFEWPHSGAPPLVSFRRAPAPYDRWQWSGYFSIASVTDLPLNVRHRDTGGSWFAHVACVEQDATMYAFIGELEPATDSLRYNLPFRIENRTLNESYRFRQHQQQNDEVGRGDALLEWNVLHPFTEQLYTWEEPTHPHSVEIQIGLFTDPKLGAMYEKNITFEIEDMKTTKIAVRNGQGTVYAHVESDGPTTVFVISELAPLEININDKDSANAETFQLASEDAKRKELKEQMRLWLNVHDDIVKLESSVVQHQQYMHDVQSKIAKIKRPAQVNPHTSLLNVSIKEAKELLVGPGDDTYVVSVISTATDKTDSRKGGHPRWLKPMSFDVTTVDPREPVRFRVIKKRLLAHDEVLGVAELPLVALNSFEPYDTWLPLTSQRGEPVGAIAVTLWWIPRDPVAIENHIRQLQHKLVDKRRILHVLQDKIYELKGKVKVTALDAFGGLNTSQIVVMPLAAKGVKTALRELGEIGAAGSVVMFVDCPALHTRNAVVLYVKHRGEHIEDLTCELWKQELLFYLPDIIIADDTSADATLQLRLYFFPHTQHSQLHRTRTAEEYQLELLRGTGGNGNLTSGAGGDAGRPRRRLHSPEAPLLLAESVIPLHAVPISKRGSMLDMKKIKDEASMKHEQSWLDMRTVHSRLVNNAKVKLSACLLIRRHLAPPEEARPELRSAIRLPFLGVDLINNEPQELLYLSLHESHLVFENAPSQQTLEVAIGKLQLDNQNPKAISPVILAPTPLPPEERQPFIQLSINKSKLFAPNSNKQQIPIEVFPYISVLVQKFDLKLEEAIVWDVLEFFGNFQASFLTRTFRVDDGSQPIVRRVSDTLHPPKQWLQRYFVKLLQLHALAVNISFLPSPERRVKAEQQTTYNPLKVLVNALGTTVAVNDAPIRINGITIEDARGSWQTLIAPILEHFKSQAVRQAYKVLGSIDILGNPVHLIGSLGSGVYSFFSEPAKGLVKGPQEFGSGVAKGSASLVKNAISGVIGAGGKITGSLGKAVAVLSLDDEFVAEASKSSTSAPEHIGEGLKGAGSALFGGIGKGISGLFVDPYKGAKEGGMKGFLGGVAKGVVGVVAKPASGAIGASSQLLKGAANTPAFFSDEKYQNKPIRPQRVFPPNKQLLPYAPRAAARTDKHVAKHDAKHERHAAGGAPAAAATTATTAAAPKPNETPKKK